MPASHLTCEGVEDPPWHAQTPLPSAEWPCRSRHPDLAGEVQGARGTVSQPLLPAGMAGEALPCLSCALKYLFRVPLIPENAVPLDGSKSIYKNSSLPADSKCTVFLCFSWPQCFMYSSCVIFVQGRIAPIISSLKTLACFCRSWCQAVVDSR